jgi:hypothetical protein
MADLSGVLASLQQGVQAVNALVQATTAQQGSLTTQVSTVANLPAAASFQGMVRLVTDANATTRLATVAGSGSNIVLVFSDGTNWKIL